MFWTNLLKVQIPIAFVISIFDPCTLNLALRLNELSYRDELGLKSKLFSRAFI